MAGPGLHPFDLNAARGAGISNALGIQKFSQNALNPAGGADFGSVNPRDFTAESLQRFSRSGNYNDLVRYERLRGEERGGVRGVLDVVSGQWTPGEIGLADEVDANRQLAGGTETGKQQAQIQYQPQKDLQEIAQLKSLKGVELDLNPQIKSAEAEATKLGAHQGQLQIDKPKAGMKVLSYGQKTTRLKANIAKARSQANVWTVGYVGAKLMDVAGTPAHDLKQTLSTLQANAGFDRLQEMRDNSVTGGALGQVSEKELKLLVDAYEALAQSQSKEQFLEKLDAFEAQLDRSWHNVELAYEITYGEKYTGQEIEPQEQTGNGIINWEDM